MRKDSLVIASQVNQMKKDEVGLQTGGLGTGIQILESPKKIRCERERENLRMSQ